MEPGYRIKELLSGRGLTLCCAESCTGGDIAHLLTLCPGSSEYFKGGVVSYAVEVKEKVLGVPSSLVDEFTVVSSEVAAAMAKGVRELLSCDFALATTGYSELEEGDKNGYVWIAVSGKNGTETVKFSSEKGRIGNISEFSRFAINFLADYISECLND